MSDKKKKYNIGNVCKGKYGPYITLEENVSVLVDGEEVPMRTNKNGKKILSLQDPVESVERMIENNIIPEEKASSRLESVKEAVSNWLKYNVVITPPKD